ncbi:MAG: hypothetical protein ACTHNW_15480 [Mucilaginibacter sp.]
MASFLATNKKTRKGLPENRAGSMALRVEGFSGLIFWFVLDQAKMNSHSGN